MVNEHFYPPIEPFAQGMLETGTEHRVYWEQCGTPDGIPIVFLHGGPGAGCWPADRRFFDPQRFRVILLDQRGCGRSRPLGQVEDNGPDDLVADIDALRQSLGIETWHVFGGSWGSTLALHYGESHPESCRSLVLRGIWMLRAAEIEWWLYGMRWFQPELWREFAEFVPESERKDLLEAYWQRMTGTDEALAREAAHRWSVYEGSCATLLPNDEFASHFADADMSWCLGRLEAHYFRNRRFDSDTQLLDRVERLHKIPAFAVHGRYDVICPVRNLLDLSGAWPELDAVIVPDAGHSSHEPGITRELVAACDRIAELGSPVRVT